MLKSDPDFRFLDLLIALSVTFLLVSAFTGARVIVSWASGSA